MLKHERSLLVCVAPETDHIPCRRCPDLPDLMIRLPNSACSVLVVAVGALNQALIYTMSERHIELGLLLQMAGIAKLGLRLNQ